VLAFWAGVVSRMMSDIDTGLLDARRREGWRAELADIRAREERCLCSRDDFDERHPNHIHISGQEAPARDPRYQTLEVEVYDDEC
jgi:hypothetical protein